MRRCLFTLAIFAMVPSTLIPQVQNFVPVTQEMLLNPNPDDWLMFSRTYDAQRFSPLRQITKQNVNQLALAIPLTAPADLYSNSTVALDPETGKLRWYYQHLPGDDWDEDINEGRTLIRTAINPDPRFVKWINPAIRRGEVRDISVNVGEGGGIWALDRSNGQFLWATPFPFDTPNFIISDIDVKTGIAKINEEVLVARPGERHTICSFNTRSWWPTAFHPGKNSLYVPYIDNCRQRAKSERAFRGREPIPIL